MYIDFFEIVTRVLNVWGGYLFCFFELSARLPVVVDCSGGSLNVSTQMQRRSRKWSRRSVSWRRSLRTPRSATYRSVRSPLLVSESVCQRKKNVCIHFCAVNFIFSKTPHFALLFYLVNKSFSLTVTFSEMRKIFHFKRFSSLQKWSFVRPVSAFMSTSDHL